jgi:hypothetical protein
MKTLIFALLTTFTLITVASLSVENTRSRYETLVIRHK